MIKIEVNQTGVGLNVKNCEVQGTLNQLIHEIVAIEATLISEVTNNNNLKPGVTRKEAMEHLADTVRDCVKEAIKKEIYDRDVDTSVTGEPQTAQDVLDSFDKAIKQAQKKAIKQAQKRAARMLPKTPQPNIPSSETMESVLQRKLGISGDEVQMNVMMLQELVDRWYPVYTETAMTQAEHDAVREEVQAAGFTMYEFIDKLLEKIEEEKK